jgi:hypothetical protein
MDHTTDGKLIFLYQYIVNHWEKKLGILQMLMTGVKK